MQYYQFGRYVVSIGPWPPDLTSGPHGLAFYWSGPVTSNSEKLVRGGGTLTKFWIHYCINSRNNKNAFQDAYRPLQWMSTEGRGCLPLCPGRGVCFWVQGGVSISGSGRVSASGSGEGVWLWVWRDVVQPPSTPPPPPVNRMKGVKTLPCPKLHLWAVKIGLNCCLWCIHTARHRNRHKYRQQWIQ